MRGRGYARADRSSRSWPPRRDEGATLALLFSEIDPAYYEAMGFVAVAAP